MVKEYRADPMNGTVIEGRYEVRTRLARGGMSTVYLAVDQRLDREVALKVLYPHLAENPDLVERFEQEAKTAARLSHPHVVNVLDQGVDEHPDGNLAYLVMEYVPGYTLRTVLERRSSMTPRVALAYLEAIVDGLAAAHRAGLVHRDMKPENVLVSRDGRIKVADFGLARATTNFTGTGAALVGTVAYISPELVSGSPADERSDVYAVGIMAYEMLTGRQPFTGSSPIQVAYQHINNEVPAPSEAVPGLATDLDRLVQWSTAPNARDRPADAAVLLAEIRSLRSSLPDEDLDIEAFTAPAAAGAAAAAAGPAGTEVLGSQGYHREAEPDDSQDADDGDGARDDGESWDQEATDVIGSVDHLNATDLLDPGATTFLPPALPPAGHHRTSVLPTLQPDEHGTPPAGPHTRQSDVSGSSGAPALEAPGTDQTDRTGTTGRPGRTGRTVRAPGRSVSARQERRQAARQAKTPTEVLGHRNGKRMWIWAAVVLIITAILVLAGWFFGAGPGGVVTVPEVEGRSKISAVDALQQTGVGYALASVHHDVVAEDSVIATDPQGGTEVRRFNTVLVTVSLGPELFAVPDLTGLGQDEAEATLQDAELALGTVTHEYSGTVEQGSILSQSPAAQDELRRNHAVSVVVSEGPQPVAVPDLSGMTVEEATSELEAAGLQLEVSGSEHSASVEAGRIITQDPAEGDVLPGSTVTAVQSLGPRMIEVPDVTGQPQGEARRQLEEAGFEVEETEILGDFFGSREGRVRNQSPESGAEAAEGSTVRILIL
ncbi:Stk1 family PASTA domain-containing Ser/Thr kinase [Citricoccus muralis]|uniref:non-specific serine/threonine protein kinase n=1 Tax=Citricoccus muralis TaxID=169134 RepID=A0A3D9LAH3_9MICC|nr:Stk1 family PASTA domain-containing Ser/Thr kinase [Citricoccus muralis]REE03371.1 serine/threonine-protein kinase [Citricoccus muralis]